MWTRLKRIPTTRRLKPPRDRCVWNRAAIGISSQHLEKLSRERGGEVNWKESPQRQQETGIIQPPQLSMVGRDVLYQTLKTTTHFHKLGSILNPSNFLNPPPRSLLALTSNLLYSPYWLQSLDILLPQPQECWDYRILLLSIFKGSELWKTHWLMVQSTNDTPNRQ